MFSKVTFAAGLVALGIALPTRATAQAAPPATEAPAAAPPAEAPPATEAPATPPPVEAPPATEAPAAAPPVEAPPVEAPPVEAPPTGEATLSPSPSAGPDDSTTKRSARRGALLGLDVGLGIPAGGSALFDRGFGQSLILGYQASTWSLQFRFAERYDLGMAHDSGAVLDGSMSSTSVVLSKSIDVGGPVMFELGAGPTDLSSSIVVTGADGFLVPKDRKSVGMVLAAGVVLPVGDRVDLTAGAHAYLLKWERVGEVVVDDGDAQSVMTSVDPKDGTPMTFTVGIRIVP